MTDQERIAAKVRSLANVMRAQRAEDERFVLMLGAGASMSSGVPKTPTIMEELLAKYGAEIQGENLGQRFDQLWKDTSDAGRALFLKPYLNQEYSVGYEKLAGLIKAGYFDVVLTFNFDELLENALTRKGFYDFRKIIRGETDQDEMQKLVDAKKPRFRLVKLHGSLNSTNYFPFAAAEIRRYPEPIETLVRNVTRRDILICGYAFNDECVSRAFSETGNSIYCVNPGGFPRNLSPFLKERRSENKDIRLGFDEFFSALHRELLESAPVSEKPPRNPFKFLEGYEKADKDSFKGREEVTARFLKFVESKPTPRVIIIAGQGKAGKTSLVRAGLLSRLDPDKYLGHYVRCPADIEASLAAHLSRDDVKCDDLDLPAALVHLSNSSPDKRVILFLDQFDRVTSRFQTKEDKRQLGEFLRKNLFAGSTDNLTIVLVVTDESGLGTRLAEECNNQDLEVRTVSCPPFEQQDVVEIMKSIATGAGFDFDQKIIEEMALKYELTRNTVAPEKRFTLAHIQAICHILAGTRSVSYDAYKGAFDENLDALHQAINVSDMTSFVEECSWPDAAWFSNMIKVPLQESKELIAAFIKAHYQELIPPDDRPGRDRKAQSGRAVSTK